MLAAALVLATKDKEGKTQARLLTRTTYPAEALPHLVALFQPPLEQTAPEPQ